MNKYDWNNAAENYLRYRPGPPDSYYDVLASMGLSFDNQYVLDLGTGPGLLACAFANRGARATGIDASREQIKQANKLAKSLGLNVNFRVCAAENLPLFSHSIDIAVANMCWGYFDHKQVLKRLLQQFSTQGALVISSLRWLSSGAIGGLTADFLKENGINTQKNDLAFSVTDYTPRVEYPGMELQAVAHYKEPLTFTSDSWIGRLKASRYWIDLASANKEQNPEEQLLEMINNQQKDEFDIDHLIMIELYRIAPGT